MYPTYFHSVWLGSIVHMIYCSSCVSCFTPDVVSCGCHLSWDAAWPEYKDTKDVIPRSAYLSARATDPRGDAVCRVKECIDKGVYMLQLRTQHHVHILNTETGTRQPLSACRRKDNPKLCKGDFPRTFWLIEKAVVLCQHLIYRIGMALTARNSKLGAFHIPLN